MKLIDKLKQHKKLILVHLLPLVIFGIFAAAISIKAKQDMNWDLLNYHFNNPRVLLHGHETANYGNSGLETYNNPLIDVPSYLLIRHFKPIVATTFIALFQSLNMWLVYEIAVLVFRRLLKGAWLYALALLIGGASFLGAGTVSEVGGTMGDTTSSVFILAGLLLVLISMASGIRLSSKQKALLKVLAYAIVGFGTAIKLTNVPYVIGLLSLELLDFKRLKVFALEILKDIGGLLIGGLLGAGAWSLYLLKTFKNPLFPLYNGIFHSPYYSQTNFVDVRWLPHGLNHVLFWPFYFIHTQHLGAEPDFRDSHLALLYLGIVAFVIFILIRLVSKHAKKIKIQKEVVALVLFSFISYIVWEKQFGYYRYILILEMLSVLVFTAVISIIVKKPKYLILIVSVVTIGLATTTKPMNWGRIPWHPDYFGISLPEHYLKPNSTVLMADGQPLSFMIAFFPQDTTFIRVDSDLSAAGPASATAGQKLLHSRLNSQLAKSSPVYAVVTQLGQKDELSAYNAYGFNIGSCQPIDTYVSKYLVSNPNYLNLCLLNKH